MQNRPNEIIFSTLSANMNSLTKLKELTNQELKKIRQNKYHIEETHSNLDLLIKRYNIHQSYIGSITEWYGSCPWWGKILLFIFAAAIGAGIGALFNMPLTISIVFCAAYLFFSYFLINNYNVTEKKLKLLCEDIIELEKDLSLTIRHFNELKRSLNDIFENLFKFNEKLQLNIYNIQKNSDALAKEVFQYKSIIQELTKAKNILCESSDKISTTFLKSSSIISDNCQIISVSKDSMHRVSNANKLSSEKLAKNADDLQEISVQYHSATQTFTETTEKIIALYDCIQKKIEVLEKQKLEKTKIPQAEDEYSDSLNKSKEPENKFIPKKDDTGIIEDAKRAREESKKIRQKALGLKDVPIRTQWTSS